MTPVFVVTPGDLICAAFLVVSLAPLAAALAVEWVRKHFGRWP